jgi:hypothetical protein
MRSRFAKLLVAYCVIAVTTLLAHLCFTWLTGVVHLNDKIWIGRQLMVDQGIVYRSLYTEALILHVIPTVIAVTIWFLMSDRAVSSDRYTWFLTSRRVNAIALVLFAFAALGAFQKGGPGDRVERAIAVVDMIVVVAFFLRIVLRMERQHGEQKV